MVEEVGLSVHDAHRAGVGQVAGRLGAVMQPLDPAKRLLLLARLGAGGIGRHGEVGAQHPERRPVGIERQGRVQLFRPCARAPVWFVPIVVSPEGGCIGRQYGASDSAPDLTVATGLGPLA